MRKNKEVSLPAHLFVLIKNIPPAREDKGNLFWIIRRRKAWRA